MQAESGSSGWYLKDPLGSVVRKLPAVSQAGKMRLGSVAEYDEFGNIIIAQGTEEDSFGYNGFLFDSVADTWYAQARQYRSETGSFDGMDRFGGDIIRINQDTILGLMMQSQLLLERLVVAPDS